MIVFVCCESIAGLLAVGVENIIKIYFFIRWLINKLTVN